MADLEVFQLDSLRSKYKEEHKATENLITNNKNKCKSDRQSGKPIKKSVPLRKKKPRQWRVSVCGREKGRHNLKCKMPHLFLAHYTETRTSIFVNSNLPQSGGVLPKKPQQRQKSCAPWTVTFTYTKTKKKK